MNTQSQVEEITNRIHAFHARIYRGDRQPTLDERDELHRLIAEKHSLERGFRPAYDGLTSGMTLPASAGERLTRTEFGQYLKKHKGRLSATGPIWTTPELNVQFSGPPDLFAAGPITEDPASGGELVVTDVIPGIQPLPTRELVVADLFEPGTTNSNSVTFMRETAIDNQAAPVAEGAVKPQSGISFGKAEEPVRKIATWLEVTTEILEDVAGLPAYLDGRLRHFVLLEEDDQLLNGDGVDPNFLGILNRPGLAPPIARVDPANNADVILDQISAIEVATQLRVDGIVMNSVNWNPILKLKDSAGNYIAGGGPFGNGLEKSLWGRTVVLTPQQAAGTATVGAFRKGATFRRRTPVRVTGSNSHADFFIRNKVALVAEERGALVVYRESAFGKVTMLT